MSDLIIKDGTGTGLRARVDAFNRLQSKSTTLSEIAHISETTANAFIFSSLENNLVASNGDYHLLWIRNNSPNLIFHMDRVFISYNGGNTTGNKTVTGRLRIGSNKPSANNTSFTGGNLNLSSGNVAAVEAYFWNGTGTGMTVTTPGTLAASSYFKQGFSEVPTEGAYILGFNNILDFSAQVAEDGPVSLIVTGWFDTLNDE